MSTAQQSLALNPPHRFEGHKKLILERLREGPATNKELCQISQRFGARILDWRELGYEIEMKLLDYKIGSYEYRLVGEP